MTVQVPIDHHFTPVFYLKAWAGADGRMIRFTRPRDRVVAKSCSPTNTGSEEELYSLVGISPERRAVLETEFFSPVDSRAAIAHQRLLAGHLNGLSPAQRVDWARFLLSMQLRGPQGLSELERLTDQTLRSAMKIDDADFNAVRKPGDPDNLYDWTLQYEPHIIKNAHKSFLPAMIDHEELGHYLINMHWATIGVASANHTLLTSDRPFISTHGWKHPETTLLFPISPQMLWIATNGPVQTSRVLQHSQNHMVRTMNDQVARVAVDFVIGTTAQHLGFVEKRMRKRDQAPVPGVVGKGRAGCPA